MYNEEKDFSMELIEKRKIKEYSITYKDEEYSYIVDYTDTDEEESLVRSDGKELTDVEQDEIMDLIHNIEDWSELEE